MNELHGGTPSAAWAELRDAQEKYLIEVAGGMSDMQSDAEVIAELREREAFIRRMAVLQHDSIDQLERRAIARQATVPSTAMFLQQVIRISPSEARQRIDAAAACSPRIGLTGEVLPPLLPELATGHAAGVLSADHTRVILKALNKLPATVSVQDHELAEHELVQAAGQFSPREVALIGERIRAHLDPDCVLTSDEDHQRLREFYLHPEADGSYTARGRLTPTCGAQLMALLTAHSAPQPSSGTAATSEAELDADVLTEAGFISPSELLDERTFAQRMHDALEQLASLALRQPDPERQSAPVQVIVTMTLAQVRDRSGWAATSFGQLMTVETALRMAGEAEITFVGQTNYGAVLCLGRTRRIASRNQTMALIARDRGCSVPGCDRPPAHCQRHHVIPWSEGGPTDVDNLTLVCDYHHREFERGGWTCQMVDGLPWWTPPRWLDPDQRPRLNHRIARR